MAGGGQRVRAAHTRTGEEAGVVCGGGVWWLGQYFSLQRGETISFYPLSHAPARGLFLFLFLFLPVSRGLSLAVSLTLSRALALRVYGCVCARGGSAQPPSYGAAARLV